MSFRVNGEIVAIADSRAQRSATAYSIEVEGKDISDVFQTESDQTDPVGRWRWRASDKVYELHRATEADWAAYEVMLSVNTDGVTLGLTDSDELERLKELYEVVHDIRGLLDRFVEVL